MARKKCCMCKKYLQVDERVISKKLLGMDTNKLFCIECLAEYLGCTVDDLNVKIQDLKDQGCRCFIEEAAIMLEENMW